MTPAPTPCFAEAALQARLYGCSNAELDRLDFGVIGFDTEGLVCRYNRFESQAAGLSPERVLGHPLFTVMAPCMSSRSTCRVRSWPTRRWCRSCSGCCRC